MATNSKGSPSLATKLGKYILSGGITIIVSAAIAYGAYRYDVGTADQQLIDNTKAITEMKATIKCNQCETEYKFDKIADLRTDMAIVKTDVKWIKDALKKDKSTSGDVAACEK